jgi:hypothetical protein
MVFTRINASALYLVIVISLVIGLICSSLVVVAYFYRSEYQKKFRHDRLKDNLNSGIDILLASPDSSYHQKSSFGLFDKEEDSVTLQKTDWGVFHLCKVQAFIQRDTLFKTFLIGNQIDSAKWGAIYLTDEDRPVSVSGKTVIKGNVFIPKAGIQSAYVDGKAYQGDKQIVSGIKLTSQKKLPVLDDRTLSALIKDFALTGDSTTLSDSLSRSFLKDTKIFDFKHQVKTLEQLTLKGNIILRSDTTLTVDSTAKLNHVLVFAKSIIIKDGFKGNGQFFATDSISVGKDCGFDYPSCLGIVRYDVPKNISQVRLSIGERTTFNGLLFTYEKTPGSAKPMISLSKNDTIRGQLYSQDALALKDQCVLIGSTMTNRFVYRTSFTLYENYLINATFNSDILSSYYLTSPLIPEASKKKKILQWLEAN